MWRYLAGAAGGLALLGGGLMLWQSMASQAKAVADAPKAVAHVGATPVDPAEPPAATEKTREEKRFGRYDKDRDGIVTREEFVASRRKAFAKLDSDGDGKLSFDEWSIKTTDRFAKADGDKSGTLTPAEFTTTKIEHKTHKPPPCVPET